MQNVINLASATADEIGKVCKEELSNEISKVFIIIIIILVMLRGTFI